MGPRDFFKKKPKPSTPDDTPLVHFSISEEEIVYAQAVAHANQAFADQITAGNMPDATAAQREWFLNNAGESVNPTEALGLTWYAHQDGGRMQLVDHEMLVATGMEDPANHPGIAALIAQKRSAGTAEMLARKARSEQQLSARGVAINEHLPCSQDVSQVQMRSTQQIADRAVCLMAVAIKGEVFNEGDVAAFQPTLHQIIDDHGLAAVLSPNEAAFVADLDPDAQTAVQFLWRYEALWVLLWALGFIDELEYPNAICDVPLSVTTIKDLGPDGFRSAAELRDATELVDAADFILRMHWAVRNAQLGQGPEAPGVVPGVVMERHHALNWLIHGEDWDHVSTNT